MPFMKILPGFILTFFFVNFSQGQIDTNKFVKYTPDFKFKEGIYLNIDQVKNNSPIPNSRIITTFDYNDMDFFDNVLSANTIYYYDNLGNRNELPTKKIWGYSRNGFIYIKVEGEYFRITLIGAICHFVASHTTFSNYNNSPYYYNSLSDPYQMAGSTYPSTEMRQYILDFINGRVFDYEPDGLEAILMEDPGLYDEYMALGKKKKQQMKFVYIRKYNESHPLYFPKN
jgi:hypothetical protein